MHLGNYFGAIKNWVALQDQYECLYGVVDLHAMTMPYDPNTLHDNTVDMFTNLMACGLDPDKCTLFIQSMIPEHTELFWLLNCVTSYGELGRMTQFKDKSEKIEDSSSKDFVSAGLFNYPALQAADILIYLADLVPVGKDQEQHLELSRNIANRFNHRFGATFPEPKPLFTEIPKLLSLADPTKKMSKSLGPKHNIGLFEDEASIRKKIKSAVTDSGESLEEGKISPGVENLLTLIRACGEEAQAEQFQRACFEGSIRYGDLKEFAANSIVTLTNEFKERRKELLQQPDLIGKRIAEGADKARQIASKTLEQVRSVVGIDYR
jgi:tryptophanyl-tRNA synthetase